MVLKPASRESSCRGARSLTRAFDSAPWTKPIIKERQPQWQWGRMIYCGNSDRLIDLEGCGGKLRWLLNIAKESKVGKRTFQLKQRWNPKGRTTNLHISSLSRASFFDTDSTSLRFWFLEWFLSECGVSCKSFVIIMFLGRSYLKLVLSSPFSLTSASWLRSRASKSLRTKSLKRLLKWDNGMTLHIYEEWEILTWWCQDWSQTWVGTLQLQSDHGLRHSRQTWGPCHSGKGIFLSWRSVVP